LFCRSQGDRFLSSSTSIKVIKKEDSSGPELVTRSFFGRVHGTELAQKATGDHMVHEKPEGDCKWKAFHDFMPPNPPHLRVIGEYKFLAPGYRVYLIRSSFEAGTLVL
jgi:hypothetical protein